MKAQEHQGTRTIIFSAADQSIHAQQTFFRNHLHHLLYSFLSEASFQSEKGTRKHTKTHTHLSTLTLKDRQSLYRRAQFLVRTRRLHVIYICFTFTNKIVLYCQLTTHTSVTPVIHTLFVPSDKAFTLFPPLVLISITSQDTETHREWPVAR